MKPKVLKSEAEYDAALAEMAAFMDAAPGSPDEEALELWGLIIQKYEQEHYPIDLPDPIDAIRFRMEQAGLRPKDLIPYIGSQSKVSEVLNRRRSLSLTMIRALHEGLGISLEVLFQPAGPGVSSRQLAAPAVGGLRGRLHREGDLAALREGRIDYDTTSEDPLTPED